MSGNSRIVLCLLLTPLFLGTGSVPAGLAAGPPGVTGTMIMPGPEKKEHHPPPPEKVETGHVKTITKVEKVKIIKLNKRRAAEVVPSLRPLLSPNGHITIDDRTNSLLITDSVAPTLKIEAMIRQLDVAMPPITFELRFADRDDRGRRGHKRGHTKSGRHYRQSEVTMLQLQPGTTTYLRIGETVPFDGYWHDLCERNGYRYTWLSRYQHVDTGFQVFSVRNGDQVELVFTPVLTFDRKRKITFTNSATRLTVPAGSWTPVGGHFRHGHEIPGAILFGSDDESGSEVELKVLLRDR